MMVFREETAQDDVRKNIIEREGDLGFEPRSQRLPMLRLPTELPTHLEYIMANKQYKGKMVSGLEKQKNARWIQITLSRFAT